MFVIYLKPHLDSRLTQIKFKRQLFAGENVGIWSTFERPLQLLQLIGGECRSANIKLSF